MNLEMNNTNSNVGNSKKISVLMSVYNETEKEINEAIESILTQSVSDFELIIVNDNPQNIEYIGLLSKWEDKDDRIKIIHNESNIGLAESMNKALKLASGEYIARMDADDISLSTRFEKELSILENGEFDIVFTNYSRIGPNGELLDNGKPVCESYSSDKMTENIVFQGIVHHPTVMMKKVFLYRVKGYRNFPCSQDQDLWIRSLEAGGRFGYIDEVLLYYRIRNNSITKKKGCQQYVTIQYILSLLTERERNNGNDSFSTTNYTNYIQKKCSAKSVENYNVASNYLESALEARREKDLLKSTYLRLKAFLVSDVLRDGYLNKVLNKKRLLLYIQQAQEGK